MSIFLGSLTVLLSLYILLTKHPVRAVLAFLGVSLLIAIFYLLIGSPLLFILQLLVYAGGIVIFILFTITTLRLKEIKRTFSPVAGVVVLLLGFSFLIGIGYLVFEIKIPPYYIISFETQEVIDNLLIKSFIPFEYISVILLVAIVGTFVLTRRETG